MLGSLNTHDDPSGLFAAIGGFAAAVLSVIAIFAPLPPGLTEAVLAVIASAGAVWTALSIRRHAYAPASVDREVNMALGGAAQVMGWRSHEAFTVDPDDDAVAEGDR